MHSEHFPQRIAMPTGEAQQPRRIPDAPGQLLMPWDDHQKDKDHTMNHANYVEYAFSPWYGCTHAASSPGCDRCAVRIFDQHLRDTSGSEHYVAPMFRRVRTDENAWREPGIWSRITYSERPLVYCSPTGDVFDREAPREWLRDLLVMTEKTPGLDWLFVTKRTNYIVRLLDQAGFLHKWPLANVWLCISAENQSCFNQRWSVLRELPAARKVLLYEPALGHIELPADAKDKLDWVIAGGETCYPPEVARPFHYKWAVSMRDQCSRMGIPFWFSGWGSKIPNDDGVPECWGKTSAAYRKGYDRIDGVRHQSAPAAK